MYTQASRGQRRLAAAIGALFGVLTFEASAQLAPTAGAHYAGRASDTGFGGNISAGAASSDSIPLDLSPVDQALPVPVQVVGNGKRVGAAGLGWDVPLSYAFHDTTVSHRRPEILSGGPAGHDRWTLTLFGERIDLVRNAADSAWIAQQGHPQLEVRSTGSDTLAIYDGDGTTYTFDSRRSGGSHLANGNLYLLTTISDSVGRTVKFTYSTPDVALSNGGQGMQVDLTKVQYNAHPTTSGCFKGEVSLQYDAPGTLLSLAMLGTTPLVRASKLTTIDINAYTSCGGSPTRLRRYNFDYADPSTHQPKPDTDTALPRLQTVTMTGREGTPEANVRLPIAAYTYGSIVDPATGKITYEKSMSVAPIIHAGAHTFDFGIGYTTIAASSAPHNPGDVVRELTTDQNLIDLNGDGRPDFHDETGFYKNVPDSAAKSTFPAGTVSGAAADIRERIQTTSFNSANSSPGGTTVLSISDTLRKVIDVNGDGRLDVVETKDSDTNNWVVHLNTPDTSDPKKIVWVDVTIPVARMRAALNTTGTSFDRVPMERTTTMPLYFAHCWYWESTNSRWQSDSLAGCSDIPANSLLPRTMTEFELKDVNGDGYPDFVFNASRVNLTDPANKPPVPNNPVPLQRASTLLAPDMAGSKDIKVLYNIAGAHLANGADLFASTASVLEAGGSSGCGIERWEADPSFTSADTNAPINEVCALEDVNGDGIADRVTSTTQGTAITTKAALGTGDLAQPFSSAAVITLPGVLRRTQTVIAPSSSGGWLTQCGFTNLAFSDTRRTRGLRDINGDGIPDYVNGATIAMGNGSGFTAPITVTSPIGMELSLERTACQSLMKGTPAGMYDLDGDGQPEMVKLIGWDQDATNPHWDVYQLKRNMPQWEVASTRSIPEAGRLTRIDNGYGVVTRIGYQSAKDDLNSLHQVPSPEVVVTATGITDGTNALIATTHYAYGNITQYFDPFADSFVSTGYARSVKVMGGESGGGTGVATITDLYGLSGFSNSMDAAARFKRYAKLGRISDVTTLSASNFATKTTPDAPIVAFVDPWALLATNISNDTRRISGSHSEWEARLLPSGTKPQGNAVCIDMMYPYDYAASVANALTTSDDFCVKNGFTFQTSTVAWRGAPGSSTQPALSTTVVTTNNEVKAADVDDFGRVKIIGVYNDLNLGDDDECVKVTYANPPTAEARPRVLNAPAQRTVDNCASTPVLLSKEAWEYDTSNGTKLPSGQVTKGYITAHIVSRLDENGQPIPTATGSGDIREFDATLDARGNPLSVTSARDDGATRTVAVTYDDFGLVPMTTTLNATNANGTSVPTIASSVARDPATLDVSTTADANGTQTGATFDGFGRMLTSTVVPSTGTSGVMAAKSYLGFAVGESGGRRIVDKQFTNPVAAADVATSAGHSTTTYLDSLGRAQRSEISLGSDYGNKILTVGARLFDLHGRVKFVADPFRTGQTFGDAYGTSTRYNIDGTPNCSLRAFGSTSSITSCDTGPSDSSLWQIYPTTYARTFEANTQVDSIQSADAKISSAPQLGVKTRIAVSAVGRPLSRTVVKANTNGTITAVLERTNFGTDALGRLVLKRRFQDPSGSTKPVDTVWHYDSLGSMVQLNEQGNVPKLRSFDSWGELIREQFCNDGTSVPCPSSDRRNTLRYDALGRLVHTEARTGGSTDTDGTLDPDTVNDYTYDAAATFVSRLSPTSVLGRMASASSSTLQVALSYDPLGRINGRGYNDRHGNTYVEKRNFFMDGSPQALHLLLNDNNFRDEQVTFTYDSAGRPRSASYSDGNGFQSLYNAVSNGSVDAWGRVVQAQYGGTSFTASYDDVGRRLINSLRFSGPSGSREITFPVLGTATPAFDPVGRERSRTEKVNGVPLTIASTYDALGRLATSTRTPAVAGIPSMQYSYDALGNLLTQVDTGQTNSANNVTSTFQTSGDLDRLCAVGYGATPPSSCNVTYNGMGDVVSEPSPTGTRTLSYYPNGDVKQIHANGSDATFKYDAFGKLQSLDLTGGSSADTRADRHFGELLSARNEIVSGTSRSVLIRSIPVPGAVATRHGPTGPWSFTFGEPRGSRYVADSAGTFVQDIDYTAFGTAKSSGTAGTGTPGQPLYANQQWNGGDALSAVGLVQLGARMYDPAIGRFMSRDPVFDHRNDNPYAFAANEPMNRSDPSGMTYIANRGINTLFHRDRDSSGGMPDGISGASPIVPSSDPAGDGISPSTGGPIVQAEGPIMELPSQSEGSEEPAPPLSPLVGGFIGPGELQRHSAGGGSVGQAAGDAARGQSWRDPFLLGDAPTSGGGWTAQEETIDGKKAVTLELTPSKDGKQDRTERWSLSIQYPLGHRPHSLWNGSRRRVGWSIPFLGRDSDSLVSGGVTLANTSAAEKDDYIIAGVSIGPYVSIGNRWLTADYSVGADVSKYTLRTLTGDQKSTAYISSTLSVTTHPGGGVFFIGLQGEMKHCGADRYEAPYGLGVTLGLGY